MKWTADLPLSPVSVPAATVAPRLRGLADAMRERTAELHQYAEQSGIVHAIIAGRVTRAGYALFLRNLLPAYHELECGLERHQQKLGMRELCRRELFRAAAIERDLARLAGPDWQQILPLLTSGNRYACLVATAAEGDGSLLIAHAYTRYLGDLAGGRMLKQRLANIVDHDAACLSFYDFPEIADLAAFARGYREALNAAATALADVDHVLDEAALAFQHNIELSEAVLAFVRQDRPDPAAVSALDK